VRCVEANSPAAKAGIEPGDIIIRLDGKPIERSADLPRIVGNTPPGTTSRITIFRRGEQRDLSIVVAEVPSDTPVVATSPAPSTNNAVIQALGLGLSDLTDAQKKALGIQGGVLVTDAQGPASRAGLREDDVIVAVANQQISNLKSLEAVLAQQKRTQPLSILFRRGEWAQYTLIRPDSR
jgi:serine protease Do